MAGKLLPFKLPPGMWHNGTQLEAAGRWYDGNMVRWQNGRMKPIGGWQNLLLAGASLSGVARGGIAWEDNAGFGHVAFGTNSALYLGQGGIFTNVTPSGMVAGQINTIIGPGYGAGTYGSGDYGTQRTTGGVTLTAATWSFAPWGQDILGVLTSDQKLYEYSVSGGTVAQVENSPTCVAVMTTNETYVVALGTGGGGKGFAWCDTGNDTVWTPSDTNNAGADELNSVGQCMAGTIVGTQNIIWTNADVHLLNYIGEPDIYAPVRLANGCGLVGPNAWGVTVQGVAIWMSWGGFFMYNGMVSPIPCDVQDYVYRNVDWEQSAKIYCGLNSTFNEITWFFPSLAGSGECDSYATLNYKDNIWYYGIQSALGARTTWLDRGAFTLPLAVDPSGVVWQHEVGYLAGGVSRVGQVYAVAGPAQIGAGDRTMRVDYCIPDADENGAQSSGVLSATFTCQSAPGDPAPRTVGPLSLAPNASGIVPMQFEGRQVSMRIDETADADWSLGALRFNTKPGGRR